MIREKFLELKLQPSCDNLESTLHAFHNIDFDHSDYDSLRAKVDSLLEVESNQDENPSAEDEAILKRLTSAVRDLENLAGIIEGEEPERIPEDDSEDLNYGEKIGDIFSSHIDKDQKVSKMFGSFKDRLAKKIPKSVKDTWEKGIHGIARIEQKERLDMSALNNSLCEQISKGIKSAITQDGNLEPILLNLHESIARINNLFSREQIQEAKTVADYISTWGEAKDYLPDSIFAPVSGMASYLNDYAQTDNIDSLEFARSEQKLIENTRGYAFLVSAAKVVNEGEKMKILYNDNVEISISKNSASFREALEKKSFHIAAFLYAEDQVATEENRIEEENARLEAERIEAAQQQAMQEAAAAEARQIASQQSQNNGEKKESFFENKRSLLGKQCKNPACGQMNGHTAYKCKKCGNFLGL